MNAMTRQPRRFAAIDIGSHQLKIKIVEIAADGAVRPLDTAEMLVPLGRETFTDGKLSFDTVRATCNTIAGFKRLIGDYGVHATRVVATSALREASNRDYMIDQIRMLTGFDVEVINNSQEKFLTYRAVRRKIRQTCAVPADSSMLYLDIGAGNIQLSRCESQRLITSQSMKLGALRIKEAISRLGKHTLDYSKVLEEYIEAHLESIEYLNGAEDISHFVLISAEAEHILAIAQKSGVKPTLLYPADDCAGSRASDAHAPADAADENGKGRRTAGMRSTGSRGVDDRNRDDRDVPASLTREQFETVYEMVLEHTPRSLSEAFDIPRVDAEILMPSMIIIHNFINRSACGQLLIPRASLVDGLVEAHVRALYPDADDSAALDLLSCARQMAERYRYNQTHTEYVEKTGLLLFDSLRRIHGLDERDRLLLQLAAIMHDTGKFIGADPHYVYSYNIIKASQLIGLSDAELAIVANVARFHSTEEPSYDNASLKKIEGADRLKAVKMIAIIRLADALDTSHRQKIRNVVIRMRGERCEISGSTMEEAVLEKWTFQMKSDFFLQVYGIRPMLILKNELMMK